MILVILYTREDSRISKRLLHVFSQWLDVRFIRSCMEMAYAFLRYGRYSYGIVDDLENSGSLADCDKSAVSEVASIIRE